VPDSTLHERPAKPREDFPLFPHRNGRWAKKVKGKFEYFGKWADDPKGDAALKLWVDNKDRLLAGRAMKQGAIEGTTVKFLCDHFLTTKKRLRTNGELSPRTFADYYASCKYISKVFGKTTLVTELDAADFSGLRARLAKRNGPHALARQITQVRMVFKYAFENGLIDKPILMGTTFKRPGKKRMRAHRQKSKLENGKRMFAAKDLLAILAKADPQLKAMVLLGINCGFGNNDCGTLPQSAIDLEAGWVDYPRPKTAVERRAPLWAETIEAINEALKIRPAHRDKAHSQLVFITRYGQPWAKDVADSPITKEFRKLLDELKLYRPGLGFYCLRHTFETVAGESRDQVAVDHIMGHSDASMAAEYREGISDERLLAVVGHVHAWLYPRCTAD
jgi:integrase